MLGLGHDVVDVAAFATQLAEPGSRMRNLFSVRELRQAAAHAQAKHDEEAVHLAAKWAGKEAVLKAWCEALGERPYPFTLDDFPWREIEILDDSRGVPHVLLSDTVVQALRESMSVGVDETSRRSDFRWHISMSHDGPVASAVAVLD
ncbi:holo-ACP synthase [Bifidobacterium aerophilum]|uniref:4'-phosphopantetheinyl transferase superfamily protein n=1 Tax=Bifidobacterium aerophilum TaxID=1798155 RepID=A0A6N9Z6Y5_9BIFI|nr:holo-ACP synthase [Bifidobacterium aerophilum]NEG90180.1 4'-phosphopantetheinyl transferase superfamily protein [Bifidobacterium aerophilum]